MTDIYLISGNKLHFNEPSFADSIALIQALQNELEKRNLKIDILNPNADLFKMDLQEVLVNNLDKILKLLSGCLTSQNIIDMVFKIGARSLYNGKQITLDLFDNKQAKSDFFPVMLAIIKGTIIPFIPARLFSAIEQMQEKNTSESIMGNILEQQSKTMGNI